MILFLDEMYDPSTGVISGMMAACSKSMLVAGLVICIDPIIYKRCTVWRIVRYNGLVLFPDG